MRTKCLFLCLITILLFVSAVEVFGQDNFTVVNRKIYVTDKDGRAWADLSSRYILKLHPEFIQELGADTISAPDPKNPQKTVEFSTGSPRQYSLQSDSSGTYAEVNFVVFKDPAKAVVYQQGIWDPVTKKEVGQLRKDGSKLVMRNDNKAVPMVQTVVRNDLWKILGNNWWIVLIVLLLGAVLTYFLIFRWLFAGLLLRRKWGVGSAQNFSWSLAALVMLGVLLGLSIYFLGLNIESFIIMGIMVAFLILSGIVWFVSGTKQA